MLSNRYNFYFQESIAADSVCIPTPANQPLSVALAIARMAIYLDLDVKIENLSVWVSPRGYNTVHIMGKIPEEFVQMVREDFPGYAGDILALQMDHTLRYIGFDHTHIFMKYGQNRERKLYRMSDAIDIGFHIPPVAGSCAIDLKTANGLVSWPSNNCENVLIFFHELSNAYAAHKLVLSTSRD